MIAIDGKSFRKSVLQGFLWLGTATSVIQLISWLSTIVIIRLLSPSDYGLMAMTTVFTGLLTTFGEFGVGSSLVQAKELSEREMRQVFGWVLITGVIGLAVAYVGAPSVARFYNQPELIPLIRVIGVTVILTMLYNVPQALFAREMNFKFRAKVEMTSQIGSVFVTLAAALIGMGVWSLVAGLIAVHALKLVIYNAARPSWTIPLFKFQGSGRLLRYGLTLTAERLVNFVYQQSDRVIVGKVLGDTLLGTYSVAMSLAAIPMEKVLPLVTQISFASYARIQHDPDRVRRNLLRSTRAVALTSFPIFFGMSAVAPLGIPIILGPKWASIVLPFQLICLILPLRALGPMLGSALQGIGRPAVSLVNLAIVAVAMAAAFLVGVRFGLIGICIAWITVYPIALLIMVARTLRAFDLPLTQYLSEIRFPFFASALMLATIHVLGRVIVTPKPVYSLILTVVFGIAFYSSLVLILKREEYAEFRSLLQR